MPRIFLFPFIQLAQAQPKVMKEELRVLIEAQYPIIYLVTPEEQRAEEAIVRIVKTMPLKRAYSWTMTQGIHEIGRVEAVGDSPQQASRQNNTIAPQMAIQAAMRNREPSVYIFKDLHPFLNTPEVIRYLRDAIAALKGSKTTFILLSPVQSIPIELEKDVVVLDFALPGMQDLSQVLEAQTRKFGTQKLSDEATEKLIKATLGLTVDEAEKVYRKAYVTKGQVTEDELSIVLSEKKQLIRRNGILEFVEEVDETIASVGGLDELKKWLLQRSNAFTESARQYGLPQPKGMLILGVPGCGKSLIAKTTSQLWGLPLLRLDMGRVFDGSTVGQSEANLRNALKTAESISPVILFIDEVEKAFAGSAGSADSDGGTSSRIFGSFLTWMQEKKSSVFVMATANRVDQLPGEFLRKGRFDEIFFVDLPNQAEREQIFQIHLSKRRPKTERFDIQELANICEGFSGAEIEQAIIAAMYEAFAQDREFTQLDIIAASRATLPLSKTMTEQVGALRDWAGQRARPAAASIAEYQRLEF